jgi:hypothetical protein
MQKKRLWNSVRLALLSVALVASGASTVLAESSSSANYQVTETQFNAGTMDACSTQYCARASIGDATSGETKSPVSTATFGSVTSSDPLLEVIVDPGVTNLGTLDTEHTATKTTIVRIRNYLSNGYILQIVGDPPKYNGHSLATPSTPTASSAGTEQFGINAVANTSPNIGADPVQVPSGEFSFGEADDSYDNPNLFKYTNGDVVARSLKSSGRTDYTISFIVNISNATPAGHYTGDFSAVVIPVY